MNGARLLKRVFNFGLEHCPNRGGELNSIAAILAQPAIGKMLSNMGLDPQQPPKDLAHEVGQDCTACAAPTVGNRHYHHRLRRQTTAGVALCAVSVRRSLSAPLFWVILH